MKLQTHFIFVTVLLMTLGGKAVGQGLCNQNGGFTLTPREGCKPLKVNISNTVPNAADVSYLANYDGVATQNLSYIETADGSYSPTYSSAGTFTILQKVVAGNVRLYQCEKVKVIETAMVGFTLVACGGGNVKVTLTTGAVLNGYDRVEINWGDGGEIEYWNKGDAVVLNHSYASTTTSPVLSLKGLYNTGECKEGLTNKATVKFENAQLADIKITSLDMASTGSLSYSFKGINGVKSQVKYSADGGTTFTEGQTWESGGNTASIRQLDASKTYVVKMSSKDGCGNDSDTKLMSSMTIKGQSNGGGVELNWNEYPIQTEFKSYELYKNGSLLETFTNIDEIEYSDSELDCEDTYVEYYVRAVLLDGTSKSSTIGVNVDHTNNKSIESASVTVSGEKVFVLANVPSKSYELLVEKAEKGEMLYRLVGRLANANEFQDDNVSPDKKSYCYKISYSSCGNQYPATPPICTILLKKDFTTFTWEKEQPFLEPVDKFTMLQNGSSGSAEQFVLTPGQPFMPKINGESDPEYTFQIRATSKDENFESFSNVAYYKSNINISFPSAFTPDGIDMHNDQIKPISEPLRSYSFTVYDRWGGVMFYTEDQAEGWDGNIKKNPKNQAAKGSYVFKVAFVDDLGQKVEKRGTFMLLR